MLHLDRAAYDALLEHARDAAPEEACGLLVGTKETETEPQERSEEPGVDGIHRMRNVAPNPEITYELDPEEQYQAMEAIEREGQELVGFYHSHPEGPDGPSTTDHAKATWVGYHYLIVSLGGERPTVDAWVWTGEQFARDDVVVESI
jgi:proteasome lid subunit RPN8/RPN11